MAARQRGARCVLALVLGQAARAQLSDAIGSRGRVTFVQRARELVAEVAQAELVVLEPTDAEDVDLAPTVARLRLAHPEVPIVAYFDVRQLSPGQLVRLVRAGVSDVVLHGVDDTRIALQGVLASATRECTAELVASRLAGRVPAATLDVVAFFVRHADSGPSVAAAAAALGVHRRTLLNRLSAAHGMTPSALAAWSRLLLAARLLDTPGRTADSVAMEAGFGSGAAFRNMLRRYTGLTPSMLRSRLGFQGLCAQFEALVLGAARGGIGRGASARPSGTRTTRRDHDPSRSW